jgi:valyl-tRNA synthetase
VPEGYDEGQRGRPGGFVGDPDIMDTWATSSLTPEIVCGWEDDPDLFARTFPMDLRPQAHDIIRTWLFSTVLRSQLEFDALPWAHAALSGWVLDPDRKKMSKSKGNVVTPMGLLEQYGSDAVRYWAASGRPGTDTAFDDGQMKVGRRLAIKLLNAAKFASGVIAGEDGREPDADATITEPLDRSMTGVLADLVEEATAAFDAYDYARALERTERFFWGFCDDYLELVKQRAYGARGDAAADSARVALREAFAVLLRLFAPHLPFVAEEVWSWRRDGSVHRAEWPAAAPIRAAAGPVGAETYEVAAAVLAEIRKAKSAARQSMRAEVARVVVRDSAARLAALEAAGDDVRLAGSVTGRLELEESGEFSVEVELATSDAA